MGVAREGERGLSRSKYICQLAGWLARKKLSNLVKKFLQTYFQNRKGNYESAKNMSKLSLMLLMPAIIVFCVIWFTGWIVGLYFMVAVGIHYYF